MFRYSQEVVVQPGAGGPDRYQTHRSLKAVVHWHLWNLSQVQWKVSAELSADSNIVSFTFSKGTLTEVRTD